MLSVPVNVAAVPVTVGCEMLVTLYSTEALLLMVVPCSVPAASANGDKPAMVNPAHSTPNSFRCDVSLYIHFSCQRHRMNAFSFVVLLFCGVSIHAYVLYSSRISVVTPAMPDTTIDLVVRETAATPSSNARGCSLPAERAVAGRRQCRAICRGWRNDCRPPKTRSGYSSLGRCRSHCFCGLGWVWCFFFWWFCFCFVFFSFLLLLL